ncbi:MAG: hypothetical protein ACP5N2_03395 [Candidatus Nanoarchaeia archaeon]
MIASKKGIMFTILAVLISAIVLASFFTFKSLPLDENVENTQMRIRNINRYAVQTDAYVGALTKSATDKTLKFTISIMIGNNSFLGNYSKEFNSCLTTGKMMVPASFIGGERQINCPPESNLVVKLNQFENFSNTRLNINSDIVVNSVDITQTSSWNVVVLVNYTLRINDSYATWNETKVLNSELSIVGLRDPTYYIMSSSSDLWDVRYPMVFNSSNTATWVEMPSTLHSLIINKKYFSWQGAPSFLLRLDNKTTPSYYGIVSIVSPDFINESNLAPGVKRSSLDFEFWKAKVITATPTQYVRYNFYKGNVDPGAYGIYSPNYGLNGTIVNISLAMTTNMDTNWYLDSP